MNFVNESLVSKFSLSRKGSQLEHLWKEEALCDVVLVSKDGVSIPAHKIILAGISSFFLASFTGAGCEMMEKESRISLPLLDGNCLRTVLEAIYTNEIQISNQNLEILLEASTFLQIESIREACCKYLESNLNVETWPTALRLAETYHCINLHNVLVRYAGVHFDQLSIAPKVKEFIHRITKETLIEIVQSSDTEIDSEHRILRFVLEWIVVDPLNRQTVANEILQRIQIDPKTLREEIAAFGLIPEALLGNTSKTHESVPSPIHLQPSATHIMAAGGHDASWKALKVVELYDPRTDSWTSGPWMPNTISIAGGASIRRTAVIVGGSAYEPEVFQYDASRRSWKLISHLKQPRLHAAVTASESLVFVCGGRTGLDEKLSTLSCTEILKLGEDVWRSGPSMQFSRYAFGATSLNEDVYVVGGQAMIIHDSVEVLPFGSDRWQLIQTARLKIPRKYFTLGTANGRLYAAGGVNEMRVRLKSVEALDPREGRWQNVGEMMIPRSSCGGATVNENLYVMGGNAADGDVQETVERYVSEANAWIFCTPMVVGRSSMSGVAI